MGKWITQPIAKVINIKKDRKVKTSTDLLDGYLTYIGAETISSNNKQVFADPYNAILANVDENLRID